MCPLSMSIWPSFDERAVHEPEIMDDFSVTDERLTVALRDIRITNRLLGGYGPSHQAIRALLSGEEPHHVLDLGSGSADYPAHLVQWADAQGLDIRVDALEANPITARHARSYLDRTLSARLRPRVQVICADVFDYAPSGASYDIAHAGLFLHHFPDDDLVRLLGRMRGLCPNGLVINDLHRHPLAYASIWLLARLLPTSPMYQHDAPLSVRRAFTQDELMRVVHKAGYASARIRWHWAFRWVVQAHPTALELPA